MIAVIATFVEAVRATGQPCTFLLLAPTLLTVAALRATWWSVAAVFGAAIVGGWLAAVNVFVLDGWLLQVSGVAVEQVDVRSDAVDDRADRDMVTP